jgi:hypothetical protein
MKSRLIYLSFIALLIISACQPDKVPDPNGPNGFGASTKPLSGTPWTLPAGVNMTSNVTTTPSGPYTELPADGTLPFYLSLQNHNTAPATVTFPAGLMLPAPDTLTQNAVIIQQDSITILAARLSQIMQT